MRKILSAFICTVLVLSLLLGLSSCKKEQTKKSDDGLFIVTTLFPQYYFAGKIAGDKGEVKLLLSPGVEAHSYDPTIRDVSEIGESDLFIYTGDEMEPWVQKVLSSASIADKNTVVNLSDGVTLLDDIDGDEKDPHMWLDMKNAVTMAEEIKNALAAKSPENADYFERNFEALKGELLTLDREFTDTVAAANGRAIVFGGRFAYKYFTESYGLNYKTVYTSCTTDVEPSSKTVAEITDYIKQNGIKYIFHEELADPKVARSIADAAGCELLEFSTGHNLSKADFDSGVSFTDIMNRNLDNLKKGLAQ